jgi:protein pelota
MKIIYQNLKKGEIKVKVENLDDLWYLSNIIDPDDLVKGKTLRKIKLGEKEQRSIKIIKKPVFIIIKTTKIEFHKYSNTLRVSGIIVQAPEDIPKGSHHTFNIEENSIITIIKKSWLKYQLEKLKEATITNITKILIIVMDREEVYFALLKRQGYQLLSHFKGDVKKKFEETKQESNFYQEIIRLIKDYLNKYKIENIILASPAFFKEDLLKEVREEEIKNKITLATCSSVDENGINEVLKRQEVRNVLQQDRISREIRMVDDLLKEISKNNLAVYGLKQTEQAVFRGATKILLLTDSLIKTMRLKNHYEKLDELLKTVESMKGEVHIINSEHEGGKKLNGLGGIGAILRYKLD